jgi:hypothetical protein
MSTSGASDSTEKALVLTRIAAPRFLVDADRALVLDGQRLDRRREAVAAVLQPQLARDAGHTSSSSAARTSSADGTPLVPLNPVAHERDCCLCGCRRSRTTASQARPAAAGRDPVGRRGRAGRPRRQPRPNARPLSPSSRRCVVVTVSEAWRSRRRAPSSGRPRSPRRRRSRCRQPHAWSAGRRSPS